MYAPEQMKELAILRALSSILIRAYHNSKRELAVMVLGATGVVLIMQLHVMSATLAAPHRAQSVKEQWIDEQTAVEGLVMCLAQSPVSHTMIAESVIITIVTFVATLGGAPTTLHVEVLKQLVHYAMDLLEVLRCLQKIYTPLDVAVESFRTAIP
jgi:uncharacterized membrane protein